MWERWLNVRAPGKERQKSEFLNVGALGVEEQDFSGGEMKKGKNLSRMRGGVVLTAQILEAA